MRKENNDGKCKIGVFDKSAVWKGAREFPVRYFSATRAGAIGDSYQDKRHGIN